ncbi:MAG: putative Ig domain-containing protein [Akkermansiaceae bacterium]|nr:putative Ig domain-containing protein [Akkermansiaceae bacterium]
MKTKIKSNSVSHAAHRSGQGLSRQASSQKPFMRFAPPMAWLALAIMALGSLVNSVQAAVWVNEDFSTLAAGSNMTLTLPLSANGSGFAKGVSPNGGALQIQYTASTPGSETRWTLSDSAFSTPRPSGYIAFKITQNANANVSTSNYMNFRLGAADASSLGTAANNWLELRFVQAASANLKVSCAGGTNLATGNLTSTAQVPIQIWYNQSGSAINYTRPDTSAVTSLATGSFAIFQNSTFVYTGAFPASIQGASAVTTAIGKMAFIVSSSQKADFTIDDLYAADTAPIVGVAPTITSSTAATAYTNVAFSYQISTDAVATSYAVASGTLPNGLSLNTTTGIISGTPTATGSATVGLTATNASGTGAAANLTITVGVPVNTFSGSNVSMNTQGSWSLGASPTSSTGVGSYMDVTLASSVTNLTTTSGSFFVKSWNVSNGSSYTLSSVKTGGNVTGSNSTTFKLGSTSPSSASFTNSVSGVANDLVYLTGNSSLTFSATNSTDANSPSTVDLSAPGNLNIGTGSNLTINAAITGSNTTYNVNKTGGGTLALNGANSYAGTTTLSDGNLTFSGSASPSRLAKVKATIANGQVTGYEVVDGGAGYTIAPYIKISPGYVVGAGGNLTDDPNSANGAASPIATATATATISNGAVTAVNITSAGGNYTYGPKVQVFSNQSPLGVGKVILAGGTLNANGDLDLSRLSWYPDGNSTATTYYRLTGSDTAINGPVTLNVAEGKTVSTSTLVGNNSTASLITKKGLGTFSLRGSGATNLLGGFNVQEGTLSINGSANACAGTGNITLSGGNLSLGKGIGSIGTYSALDLAAVLYPTANATITLDSNPATATASNFSSVTSLVAGGGKTITVAKSSAANAGVKMVFRSANLTGTTTLDVADSTGVALGSATGTGGIIKTGSGKLILGIIPNSAAPPVDQIGNNTYSGTTVINAGTLVLGGNSTQASSITIASGAAAEFTVGDAVATTSGNLTLSSGSLIRILGTPTASSYTLVTASGGITGTPALESSVSGYSISKSGNSLVLTATPTLSAYGTWSTVTYSLTGNNTLTTADPDNDGMNNALEFVLGGNPSSNDVATKAPQITNGSSSITLSFKRTDASETQLAVVKVQVSADLATWNTADDITIGATSGNGANGSSYTVTENGSADDDVVVSIPKSNATKKFVRLKAVVPTD